MIDEAWNGRELLRVVLYVHDQFKERNSKPGAEFWTTTEAGREILYAEIEKNWCTYHGSKEFDVFPFSKDAVIAVWIRFRKATEGQKAEIRSSLNGSAMF